MAVFKCKMCGGALEVTEGMTVCECEYCGTTQTLPKTDNEQSLNLFNRANHFRQQCEFDKAAEIYEKMTAQSGADAELYWSLVLCRYGIEYVDDPLTHKKIATCHRTQFKSILDDPDYQTALQYADFAQRSVYEREAAYIDKVQKGILEISNKEQPFDVFICYKETDENGRRTPDSVLAQELYYGLTQEGFKVFFSRITLESKLGTEYEPYIFAALNSAKVMVVVGTKPEYFNAVWVRNEWSRYLMLMQEDRSRTLIPAYKDMDPYDLPDALSMFQAQDMSKLGFMQDLVRGIKKIAAPEQEKPVVQQTVIQQTPVNSNIENLLKRGFLCLEDGKWKEANSFFEQVLNENVEEHRAYIGKLCAEMNVPNEQALESKPNAQGIIKPQIDFTVSDNYKKACRFGGEAVQTRLFGYYQQGNYNLAAALLATAQTPQDCEGAKNLFAELGNYSDSINRIEECSQKALQFLYDAAIAAMKQAAENKNSSESTFRNVQKMFSELGDYNDSVQKAEECAKEAEKKREEEEYNKKLNMYNQAVRLMDSGTRTDLTDASGKFRALGDFKDSAELNRVCLEKIQKIEAKEEQTRQEWAEKSRKAEIMKKRIVIISFISAAVIATSAILNFTVIVPNAKYNKANALLESGNYDEAASVYSELGGFKDSYDMIKECNYQKALSLMDSGNYDEAKSVFSNLMDYKDAQTQKNQIEYDQQFNEAVNQYESKEYKDALSNFISLRDEQYRVDEVNQYLEKAQKEFYEIGIGYMDSAQYDEAIVVFRWLSSYADLSYSDSSDKLEEAKEKRIVSILETGDILATYEECKKENISFQELLESNGMGDIYNQYHEDFLKYAGKYYELYEHLDGSIEKRKDLYLNVDIKEDNWSFTIVKTSGGSTYSYGTYYYQFKKNAEYHNEGELYVVKTDNNQILDKSLNSVFEK